MRILHPDSQCVADEEIATNELVVVVTRDDLRSLASGMNEAINEVEDWEFQTRLGITKPEARQLCMRVIGALRAADPE